MVKMIINSKTSNHFKYMVLPSITIQTCWWITMACYFHGFVDQQSLSLFMDQLDIYCDSKWVFLPGFVTFFLLGIMGQAVGYNLYHHYLLGRFSCRVLQQLGILLTAMTTGLFFIPTPNDVGLVFLLNLLRSLLAAPLLSMALESLQHRMPATFLAVFVGCALATVGMAVVGYTLGSTHPLPWSTLQGIRWMSSIIPALLQLLCLLGMQVRALKKK